MPGGNFNGANFKQGLITAAPMFNAMAAGYASGRGPYAYMDQGAAMIQENMKRKRDEEAAAAAAAAFGGLMQPGGMVPGGLGMAAKGGGFPVSTAPRNPMDPTSISGDTMAALGKDSGTAGYRASLIGTESGGNWRASNNETGAGGKKGHFGRVQFGQARLQEAMNAGAIPQGTTPEQFMNSPALQIAAENWHFADLESKLGDLVGTVVNGQPMTMGALVAMGHLGGAGGARRYVESGGQYNPSDSFGTSLADYAATHGGQPVTMSAKGETTIPAGPVDPMTDPYVRQLMGVMAMEGLSPERRAVVETMLQSRIQTITTPQPGAEEEAARAMRARDAELLGYGRGTPEWTQYVVTGQQPEAAKPLEVGGVLLDPNTYEPIFDSREPPKPEAPTTKNVKLPDGSEVMVQWNPETQVWDAAPIPQGGTTGAGQKLTESQSKLTLFQTLQTETAPVLGQLEQQWDPANLADPSLASIPIAGNYFTSPEYQMYSTAAAAWAEGALRISTGAAATQPEIDRIVKVYFAQPGDTPQTVQFKASMRAMYDRAVNNALGKPNGGGSLMLPSDFATVVGAQPGAASAAAPATAPQPGGVLKFDANGNVIP